MASHWWICARKGKMEGALKAALTPPSTEWCPFQRSSLSAVLHKHQTAGSEDCGLRGLRAQRTTLEKKKLDYKKIILNLLPKRTHSFVTELGETDPKKKLWVTVGGQDNRPN